MSLSLDRQILADRCRSFYDSALPKGAKIKTLQGILGLSPDAAEKMAAGRLPTTSHLVLLARHFGRSFVDYVFRDVAGEMPTETEFAEVEAIRRALDEQGMVAVAPSAAVALVAPVVGLCAEARGEDRREAGLAVTRRSLDTIAGRKSHLATHLRRWAESSAKAERSSLINMARQTPHLRTSITTQRGDDLFFAHISPAFRLHAVDREKLVGQRITDTFDRDYAEACAANTRAVLASGRPAVDDVDAMIAVEPGVSLHLRYRRLILPYLEGRTPFAVCASEPIAGTA